MAASIGPFSDDAEIVENLEIDLLLEGVQRRFGHDFRDYRREAVRGRLRTLMAWYGLQTVSALQDRVMHYPAVGDALLRTLSIRPLPLFDDPGYFRALRTVLVPWLRSCPSPRIWIAECVCAEQVCALAILLREEGLYERTQIFATAANETLLREAREGTFALERVPQYMDNYRHSGGCADFSAYVGQRDGKAVFSSQLRANITWSQYNLATDASFNEFQLIVCRHVLPDYGALLRRCVLQLFDDSMPLFGILSVDNVKELAVAPFAARYRGIAERQDLYRRAG